MNHKAALLALVIISSPLAGCTSSDTSDLELQISDLQQSNAEMNETISQQDQTNADLITSIEVINQQITNLQQSNNEMNESITLEIQQLVSSITSIQSEISASQSLINSIILELENGNSTNEDLLNQLIQTQQSISSLELQLNITTTYLFNQINAANDSVDWSWMDLSNFWNPLILDLSNANLSHANLRDADLSYANLSHADLSYVFFAMSDLSYADLSYANLSNATNLFSVDLTGVTWYYTICPDGTNTEESGICTGW